MRFIVMDWAASKGDGPDMEDLAGWNRSSAWLIDGATDLADTVRPRASITGAKWIAGFVNDLLNDLPIGNHTRIDLAEVARRVSARLGTVGRGLPPACSVAVAQVREDQLLLTSAGDVYAYEYSTGYSLETPVFSLNEANAMHLGVSKSDFLRGAAERRRGYIDGVDHAWILANNPSIKPRANSISGAKGPVLLMSDGFARLVRPYGIFDSIAELARYVLCEGLQSAMDRLREFEAISYSGQHFKASDDAAALLLALESEL